MKVSLSSKNQLPSLESVGILFEGWRSNRRYRTQAIPAALWSEAALLVGRYREEDIVRHLKIKLKQFREIALSHSSAVVPPSKSTDFVTLSLPGQFPCSEERCDVELKHPHGMTLRLQAINERQLASLLIFMKSC